jgi:serine/threonine protein kinase
LAQVASASLPAVLTLIEMVRMVPLPPYGAMKKVYLGGAREAQVRARFSAEIKALQELADEPGILRLLDADPEEAWMVTEFHPQTLDQALPAFAANPLKCLHAFRPLVAAVARLHQDGLVHRDIKLKNVFVAEDEHLVLGDFGIVFLPDTSRLTTTSERVGSRDWTAPWADVRARLDEVRPSADVFALGKVLWSMAAGEPSLPLWYHAEEGYDLTKRHPHSHGMKVINTILARTVVEREKDCLASAERVNDFETRASRI